MIRIIRQRIASFLLWLAWIIVQKDKAPRFLGWLARKIYPEASDPAIHIVKNRHSR